MRRPEYRGLGWYVTHAFLFSTIAAVYKHLIPLFNVFQITFLQTLFATPVLYVLCVKSGQKLVPLQHQGLHLKRSLSWLIATAIYFYALQFIDLPKATAIKFSVPLFTSILAILWLGEKATPSRFVSLFFGFCGMTVILETGLPGFEMASVLILIASFLWSFTDIFIKLLSKHVDPIIKTFYFACYSSLFSLPMALYYWKMPLGTEWLWFMGLAALFVCNIISVSHAYKAVDLTVLMPFSFTQLIFIAFYSTVFFNEPITLNTVLGSCIIICSTSFCAYHERKRQQTIRLKEQTIL